MTDNKRTKIFAERLNTALDMLNVVGLRKGRAAFLASQFGITATGANKWIKGLAFPSVANRKKIAYQLGINYEWLETGKGEITKNAKPLITIPILTANDAISYQPNKKLEYEARNHTIIASELNPSSTYFAIKATDVTPYFQENVSIYIIEPGASYKNNSMILVTSQDSKKISLVKLHRFNDEKFIHSPCGEQEFCKLNEHIKIIGTLVESRTLFIPKAET